MHRIQLVPLAENAGLELHASASAMFWEPDSGRIGEARVQRGTNQEAAFLGLLFGKAGATPAVLKALED